MAHQMMLTVRCLWLLLAMCLSVSLALECSRAEDGYETFPSLPGSRHKLYTLRHTWPEALSLCQGDGGGSHLVIINSQDDADVVSEMFARLPADDGSLYVGMNDIVQEGTWVTIQGGLVSTSGYNKWGSNEPGPGSSEERYQPTYENCGAVGRTSLYGDVGCDRLHPFICEKPDV